MNKVHYGWEEKYPESNESSGWGTACGLDGFEDYTLDWEKVTCKRCRSKMFTYIAPGRIHIDGWEIPKEYGAYLIDRNLPVDIRQKARKYIKGLKIIFQNIEKASFEVMGENYHGNVNTITEKFNKAVRSVTEDEIIKIGNGDIFVEIQTFVDGSCKVVNGDYNGSNL